MLQQVVEKLNNVEPKARWLYSWLAGDMFDRKGLRSLSETMESRAEAAEVGDGQKLSQLARTYSEMPENVGGEMWVFIGKENNGCYFIIQCA